MSKINVDLDKRLQQTEACYSFEKLNYDSGLLDKNVDVNAAIARLEEADAYLKQIGAALIPSVDLTSQGNRTKATETGIVPSNFVKPFRKNFNIQLGTSFELDFWGRLRRAKESARAEYISSQY